MKSRLTGLYLEQTYNYFHPTICYRFFNNVTYKGEVEITTRLVERSIACEKDGDSPHPAPIFEIIDVRIYKGLTDINSSKQAMEITVRTINEFFKKRLEGKFLCAQCLRDDAYIGSLLKIYTSTIA